MPHIVLVDTDILRAGSRLVWMLIAAMGLATAATFWASSLSITWKIFPYVPAAIIACGALNLFYRFFRPDPAIVYATELITQILLIGLLGGLLAYGAAASGLPYRDAELLAADRWLGFDLQWYLGFVDSRPWLARLSFVAYNTMLWQAPIVFFVLLLTQHVERLQSFVASLAISLVITIAIFALFPALGWHGYLFPQLSFIRDFVPHLKEVRSGALRAIPVDDIRGIISFPSYHAAVAMLAIWALWPVRFIRWPTLMLNVLMIASTPIEGAHYFVDVIGGLAIGACAVLIAARMRDVIRRHWPDSARGRSIPEHLATAPD
jgi:membrane-associated phospholipid phosphatase